MKKIICTTAIMLLALATQAQARQEKSQSGAATEKQVNPANTAVQQPKSSKKTASRKQAGTAESQSAPAQKSDAAAPKSEKNKASSKAASQPVQQETIMPDGTSVPAGTGERQAGASDKQANPASTARRADGKAAASQNAAAGQPTDARKAASETKAKEAPKSTSETNR